MSSFQSAEWNGKAEPSSPHFSDHDDLWLLEDNFARDFLLEVDGKLAYPVESNLTQTRAELAQQLLNELEQVKEEPFSQWLEEKIDLPLFEEFSMDTSIATSNSITGFAKCAEQCNTTPLQDEYDTQSLLKEFQYVYDTVGMNHLTPPQSPPASSSNASFYPQQSNLQSTYTNLVVPTNNELIVVNCPQVRHPVDVQQELADVEELVRSRAQDIIPGDESDLLSSWMGDRDDEEEGGVASPTSDSTSSSDRDDDWVPQQLAIRSSGKGRANKPYARAGTEDRKSRKKEQNKNAATRYRQKKKAQIEEILGEEKGLLDRNEELKTQCDDVQREIKYLKGLMRDLFKAKGLI